MSLVPVIFIFFNRPDTALRVFETIRRARPAQLYLISDGARRGRPGELEAIVGLRREIESRIDWPCEVIRDYVMENMGCGMRIATGITEAFSHYDRAIILEDDCLPDDTFFPFCAEMLDRHRGDTRIAQVGGSNCAQVAGHEDGLSYYYSRYTNCWGWGTWRRAWARYEFSLPPRAHELLPRNLPPQVVRALRRSFREVHDGKIDTWDYQWTFACMRMGLLSVVPATNLVSNIGFGAGATHTRNSHPAADLPRFAMRFPLSHPGLVVPNAEHDDRVARLLYWRARPVERLLRSLRKRVGIA